MPAPLVVKIGKIDIPAAEHKAVAQKAAEKAAKSAAGSTKFAKKYEVTLAVKVEFDKKDKPTKVSASASFTVTADGALVPRLAASKSGVATADRFGGDVAGGVDQAVDAIVACVVEKLAKAIAELDKLEAKGK